VKYAEEHVARAPAAAAATKDDARGETIGQLKNELRRAWTARGMNREDVNALGRKLTGKEPTEFLFNLTDLQSIKKRRRGG
jgi:hypothetical protein